MGNASANGRATASELRGRRAEGNSAADESNGMALEDLIWTIPRFVDRTSKQIELVRVLATHLPCVGSLLDAGATRSRNESSSSTDTVESVDVIEVLTSEPAAPAADDHYDSTHVVAPEPVNTVVPPESELGVASYDSLAASQVVPRLTTLNEADLQRILTYEQAHRNRQTIIHRVRQLLDQ